MRLLSSAGPSIISTVNEAAASAVIVALPAVLTLCLVRRCRIILSTATRLSLRFEGIRDAIGAAIWLVLAATAFFVPRSSFKSYLLAAAELGGLAIFCVVHLLAQRAWRSERRTEELAMRKQKLPVRDRMLSWEMVGLLSLVGGVFVVWIVETLIVVALTLMGDRGDLLCRWGGLPDAPPMAPHQADRSTLLASVSRRGRCARVPATATRNTHSGRKHSEVDQQLPHLDGDNQNDDHPRWPRHMPTRAVVSADRSDHNHGCHG